MEATTQSQKLLLRFAKSSVFLLLASVLFGIFAIFYYTPQFQILNQLGLSFQKLRPLHTAAAIGWIYLGGITVVSHFLLNFRNDSPEMLKAILSSLKLTYFLWVLAGAGTLVSLLSGFFTGREYIVFHPVFSVLIFLGWINYFRIFLKILGKELKSAPVYVWMWLTSLLLFSYCFIETHSYLLPYFRGYPLRDMAVQWKSYGSLVGSFNLLVYGGLIYLAEKMNDDSRHCYSKSAFFLFFISIINSFTNYGHHTYHLPQTTLLKWISFGVSMLEILMLVKVTYDLFGVKKLISCHYSQSRSEESSPGRSQAAVLCSFTHVWVFLQLVVSLLISIPPLNAVIHGSLVVVAHAMGTMIGIDTMGLLAIFSFLFWRNQPGRGMYPIYLLNAGLLVLWSVFLLHGLRDSLMLMGFGIPSSSLTLANWFSPIAVSGGFFVFLAIVLRGGGFLIARRSDSG